MEKVKELFKEAVNRQYYQDGVINGIKTFSNYLCESEKPKTKEYIQKVEIALISSYLDQVRKLKESKQPQFIFTENREAYIDILRANEWSQEDYVYLYEAEQLEGLSTPVVHYMGRYTFNPKYDEVRKMERSRTFKNKD